MKTAIKILERELESLENRVKMGDLYPLVENYKLEIPEIKKAIRELKNIDALSNTRLLSLNQKNRKHDFRKNK